MQTGTFFAYSWHVDESEINRTVIHIYGVDSKNNNICVMVEDFYPWVYIELPDDIEWTPGRVNKLGDHIDYIMGKRKHGHHEFEDRSPQTKTLVMRRKLYYANINPENGKKKEYPFLLCTFANVEDINLLRKKLYREQDIRGDIGKIRLKLHEHNASPILQFTSQYKLPTAGWIKFKGTRVENDDMFTSCDSEYIVSKRKIRPLLHCDDVPEPLIMGFDIEVNSDNPMRMPLASHPQDKIFQISCIFMRHGQTEEKEFEQYLISMGNPDPNIVGDEVEIWCCDTEDAVLTSFTELVREKNPNIITGYNILGFDIPRMIDRAVGACACIREFSVLGFPKYKECKIKDIRWESKAYGDQVFKCLDVEGRLIVDLLPLAKRDYKLGNYRLNTVAAHFKLGAKDPLSAKGIFKCYRIGMKGGRKGARAMGIVGKYCVKDTILVNHLFNSMMCWVGLTELAKVCCVPIFYLYTQGQQIKVFSQIYKKCIHDGYIVQKDAYVTKEDDHYQGAHVFVPKPGIYDRVVPFDFSSLYPTVIISHNLDYSTAVQDDDPVSNEDCHVLEWEDHVGCEHDTTVRKTKVKHIMCCKRRFRFLKRPLGVLPSILKNLLTTRKRVKKLMKVVKKRLNGDLTNADDVKLFNSLKMGIPPTGSLTERQRRDLSVRFDVLNKRQLALKISANSGYGITGTRRGYLPFMPVAMCTTFKGRESILRVAEELQSTKYKGKLVMGDTDCVRGDSPVLVRRNNTIFYTTIDEISDEDWKSISDVKDISMVRNNYEIWSDNGFTKIVAVVRCKVNKPLTRVVVHTGVVECSDEHSLLRDNLERVSPKEAKLGDRLCTHHLPLPNDTPDRPIYSRRLTEQMIRDYEIPNEEYKGLSAELAFVWGMFYADGSCGSYIRKNGRGYIHTWAINNKDNKLLERCRDILIRKETGMNFTILDTMKSSGVNKLVAQCRNKMFPFVRRYRSMFYNERKQKKIPIKIFNTPFTIRQAYFMGYYAGDGSRKTLEISLSNKGAVGTAGLFFLMKSVGYKVSVSVRADKPNVYRLRAYDPSINFRKGHNVIKKLIPVEMKDDEYIYDIQTENHHFSAGVGELVVHNSTYITFPHLTTAEEVWDYSIHVAREVSKLFPAPMELEFENKIYWRFLILTKKRYMSLSCERDGKVEDKLNKKGVVLVRRDNPEVIRKIYKRIVKDIFDKVDVEDILYYLVTEINRICSFGYPVDDFTITKSVGNYGVVGEQGYQLEVKVDEDNPKKGYVGRYKVDILPKTKKEREHKLNLKNTRDENTYYERCLGAPVQLAIRMCRRGNPIEMGTRIEYNVCLEPGHTAKQYEKIEYVPYFKKFRDVLRLDHLYYIKLMANPVDEVLNCIFGGDDEKEGDLQAPSASLGPPEEKKEEKKIGRGFRDPPPEEKKEEKVIRKIKNFVLNQYKFRWKVRQRVIDEIKNYSKPKIRLIRTDGSEVKEVKVEKKRRSGGGRSSGSGGKGGGRGKKKSNNDEDEADIEDDDEDEKEESERKEEEAKDKKATREVVNKLKGRIPGLLRRERLGM